jgi:predicted nucleic acid-binding protein
VRSVFVDSGGFFALIVRTDEHHERAHALFARADAERWRLVTTNAVVWEAHALLVNRARPGHEAALRLLDLVEADPYRVERVRKRDEERAAALVRGQADKGYSYCDALSFVVMERLGVREAIAFDRHFRDYGRWTLL